MDDHRDFLSSIRAIMYDVLGQYDVTTIRSVGGVCETNSFYGNGVKEVVIANRDDFPLVNDWRVLKPLRILTHPGTDLSLNVPGRYMRDKYTGYAVIDMNYPMLMYKYWLWKKDKDASTRMDGEIELGAKEFVHMAILPELLRDHIDLAIFNRLYNDMFEYEDNDTSKDHGFELVRYDKALDKVLSVYIKRIETEPLLTEDLIKSIPVVEHSNMYDLLQLPDLYQNKQVTWALFLAHQKVLEFVIYYDYIQGSKVNLTKSKTFQRWGRKMLRGNLLPTLLDRHTRKDISTTIERLMDLAT
jgi:hypothetical protein